MGKCGLSFAFFTWYAGPMKATTAMDMEVVPQESMAQCEANGAALKEYLVKLDGNV